MERLSLRSRSGHHGQCEVAFLVRGPRDESLGTAYGNARVILAGSPFASALVEGEGNTRSLGQIATEYPPAIQGKGVSKNSSTACVSELYPPPPALWLGLTCARGGGPIAEDPSSVVIAVTAPDALEDCLTSLVGGVARTR